MRQRPFPAALHVENPRDKPVAFAVVPCHFALRARHPLEHAALLPVPRARASEFDPLVVVLRIHHPDADRVLGNRRTSFKIHFVGHNESVGRIEKQFVVIAAPVKLWPARDLTDRRQRFFRCPRAPSCRRGNRNGKRLEEMTSAERFHAS